MEDEKDSPPHCGSNTFLIEEVPTTVELNCWDRDLNSTIYYSMTKKMEGIMIRPDGMVKIERLDDIVTRVEVDVADRLVSTSFWGYGNNLGPISLIYGSRNDSILLIIL